MSSNHRGQRPGARRSEDARRQSAGVRRSFFANNSSASPAEDVLGLVLLAGDRCAVLPSMHGRSFTAPLTREALLAERRAAAEREPSKASWRLHFAHFSINCRHAYSHARLPTPFSHPFSRKHRSCLQRSCCISPMRLTVCGLRVVCIPTIPLREP